MPVWLAALWWGSLTTIGFLVVPSLLLHLPTPAMAGSMAAHLFAAQSWVSCGCGLLLLQTRLSYVLVPVRIGRVAIIFIVVGMLLALLSEFSVAPRIVRRENLHFWHSIGSVMYLLQWTCAAATFWKLMPPRPMNQV